MAALLEAYITNLGKYTEGQLVGETLKFPATTEELQALLKRIGIDGIRYEEIFITDFDGDVLGLHTGPCHSVLRFALWPARRGRVADRQAGRAQLFFEVLYHGLTALGHFVPKQQGG